jgi:hypothetical protein
VWPAHAGASEQITPLCSPWLDRAGKAMTVQLAGSARVAAWPPDRQRSGRPGGGEAAWFKDSEGNLIGLVPG